MIRTIVEERERTIMLAAPRCNELKKVFFDGQYALQDDSLEVFVCSHEYCSSRRKLMQIICSDECELD